jgi:hypothetical protein
MLAPNNNRGMAYQIDEKYLTVFSEYFVGVVKQAINCYNNHFLLCVFTNNHLKISNWWEVINCFSRILCWGG